MTAEKGNKVYTITEAEKDTYQSQGYDIFEDGKIIAYGKGKTIPYETYMKLKEENEKLKEENENLKAQPKTKKAGA